MKGYCNKCLTIQKIDKYNNCFDCIKNHSNKVYKKCTDCKKIKNYNDFLAKFNYCNKCNIKKIIE